MSRAGKGARKRRQSDVVADAFDAAMLVHVCETDDFTQWADRVELPHDRFYWYRDNGARVLAVAHLDTVQHDRTCHVVDSAAGLLAVSGALDDRLGAYVILELLPRLGITCDVLLTTDEERGQSTAYEFAEDYAEGKQYDWIIEFDRGGTDVVMYQYETPELIAMVESIGARVGDGSYSDIADLESLGCAAFNWGVGYVDYHSPRAHAWLADTFRMVSRYVSFHALFAGQYLEHVPDERDSWLEADAWIVKNDNAWQEECWIDADCGHSVDIADELTYREVSRDYIVCVVCAADPYQAGETR